MRLTCISTEYRESQIGYTCSKCSLLYTLADSNLLTTNNKEMFLILTCKGTVFLIVRKILNRHTSQQFYLALLSVSCYSPFSV